MTSIVENRIETPSGKGAGDENFPVGSLLIEKRLRPYVATYYAFARAIDDIADDPESSREEKLNRLESMDRALAEGHDAENKQLRKAHRLRKVFQQTGVNPAHARDLISAFKQDAVKNRYASWVELMGYCDHSAAPVGRFLLELHGEDRAHFSASDALCNALQVLNHLQDLKQDLSMLDRCYLPQVWLRANGVALDDIRADKTSDGLRKVIDQCLKGTRELLQRADELPGLLTSRRLAMETAVILRIAWKLAGELARRDPLAERVRLGKIQYAAAMAGGAWQGLWGRAK